MTPPYVFLALVLGTVIGVIAVLLLSIVAHEVFRW